MSYGPERLLVSLGGTCAVTFNIRKFLSSKGEFAARFPFDWAKTSIKQLISVLEKDFEDYEKLEIKKFSENHPILEQDEEIIKDTQGSLILVNPYGITFAHQIIEKSAVQSFSYFLREERVKAFKSLFSKNSELVFVRFETGKLKSSYLEDLTSLMRQLSRYCAQFEFILVIHESNKELLSTYSAEASEIAAKYLHIVYFDTFDEDWRYTSIDWTSIFSS